MSLVFDLLLSFKIVIFAIPTSVNEVTNSNDLLSDIVYLGS